MQNDLYLFINQLAAQLKKQEEQLAKLEKKNSELSEAIQTLEKQPPINVERIDYHFDQLKIERLDGTLNIGLNPQDLQGMDELSIPQPISRGGTNKANANQFTQLQKKIHTYLDEELPAFIESVKKEKQFELDDSYINFIKEDIRKQLPDRLAFYAQKLGKQGREISVEEEEKFIYQHLIQDIQQAIYSFFKQFPSKGKKGGEQNDSGSSQP
ncbi:spore germination protein GerPC [Bacillus andreraoultii]|uniref:spore germination protein GerPC n=1 Tax=Bacillus andreraoultii TaxID=1499685 RepID=UPI00053A9CFA|nr:spore germination protein GerPC [Bacillus andreraoultii]